LNKYPTRQIRDDLPLRLGISLRLNGLPDELDAALGVGIGAGILRETYTGQTDIGMMTGFRGEGFAEDDKFALIE